MVFISLIKLKIRHAEAADPGTLEAKPFQESCFAGVGSGRSKKKRDVQRRLSSGHNRPPRGQGGRLDCSSNDTIESINGGHQNGGGGCQICQAGKNRPSDESLSRDISEKWHPDSRVPSAAEII